MNTAESATVQLYRSSSSIGTQFISHYESLQFMELNLVCRTSLRRSTAIDYVEWADSSDDDFDVCINS